MSDFPHLLSPASIGSMQLRNRIVLPGMDTNHCDAGELTDAEIDHYAARAAGGCPLVFTGASAIAWPLGATSTKQAALSDDRFLPGLRQLADAVHSHGGKVGVQLVHHGKVSSVDTAQGRPMLVPSIPPERMDLSALADNPIDELMRLATATQGKPATYSVATTDDIAWAIERFAEAAARVKSAGIDAVEIHGAHGYLISTFLSRAYNHRDDQYGGPLENRARILVEVIRAVRDRVGPGYPIVVRLNGCEYGIDDGITPDETAETARIAEEAGADAIHVSANAANPFRDFTLGPLPMEVGQYREMAALVKRSVTIPVIAVGRLLPELAEEMIAGGECDFVSMGRQQLADPQLVTKLIEGRRAAIRPCINCYVCVEQNFFDGSAICAVNPALGDEAQAVRQTELTSESRHVVVVGGGPAGLEAARIAARRGHRVTLLERSSRLGGSTWLASLTHSPNEMLVDWLCHEIADAGVDVKLDVDATIETVSDLHPDVVIVATGAQAQPGATDARDVVETLAISPARRRVTIVGGDLIGLSLADFLVGNGHDVTVLHAGAHLGVAMAMPRRWTAVASLAARGVELVRGATISTIADTEVHYSVGDAEHVVPFDHLIRTDDRRPDATLAEQLSALGISAHVVGDAASLGYLQGAMHSAHHVATTI